MTIFKCKMCGGTLEINANETTATCEYCGTKQTIPKLDNDRKANLYDRANHFRRSNDYDKAMSIYEQILNDDNTDSEAYWSLVLCRYGIEYVEDPSTHKRVPTINRAQFTSIYADEDYKAALQYADVFQKDIYEAEAKAIDEIQKGILAISQKEEPFDVFICYKETDDNGRRTQDSVLANDLYYQLTQEGFKVFFARITLEDKLGSAYEPYIFAALNSAKAMVVLGTKPEFFNAVWVKNEWSRYLALIRSGAKKVLIPAYRDMDPYDLPEEFSHLQAQDMSKLGFMQDLIRGIKKIIITDEPKVMQQETVVAEGKGNISSLIKRMYIFLEDGNWESADDYCEKVLDIDPENAEAYLGKMLSTYRATSEENLIKSAHADVNPLSENGYYNKALRFANEELRLRLIDLNNRFIYGSGMALFQTARSEGDFLKAKILFDSVSDYYNAKEKSGECERMAVECTYNKAVNILTASNDKGMLNFASKEFKRINEYKDSAEKAVACEQKIKKIEEDAKKDTIYNKALIILESDKSSVQDMEEAISYFSQISGWKDSDTRITECKGRIDSIIAKKQKGKKIAKKYIIIITTSVVIITFLIVLFKVIVPNHKYNKAVSLMSEGKYTEAVSIFEEINEYKDSEDLLAEIIMHEKYNNAVSLMNEGKYTEAIPILEEIKKYKDSKYLLKVCNERILPEYNESILSEKYNNAVSLMNEGKYTEAISIFENIKEYKDSEDLLEACNERILSEKYNNAVSLMNEGKYTEAISIFEKTKEYKDSKDLLEECNESILSEKYNNAVSLMNEGKYTKAISIFKEINDYKDSKNLLVKCISHINNVTLSVGYYHTVGLKTDGTVVATGNNYWGQCDVSDWNNITSVSAEDNHTVGLKADGTVVATGDNTAGQCDVSGWRDIIAISAGDNHTVGLKADGTVVATGDFVTGRWDVSKWRDIIAISAGDDHTVGLKADGTVVATGDNTAGQCDVSGWRDIIAISAGGHHTVGLKADGTVVATGDFVAEQCDVSGWRDIIAISAGDDYTVGLKADGTVVATGDFVDGKCNVSEWRNIIAISAGYDYTGGLKADGTVVETGDIRGDVSEWKDIKTNNIN